MGSERGPIGPDCPERVFAIASPNFLTTYNLTVVIREASFVGLVALGLTLVLLLGGIDLRWAQPPPSQPL